jgi:hypothetical protein
MTMSDYQSGQAGAEIEVTPAMMAAGENVIEKRSAFYEAGILASLVYTAMEQARYSDCRTERA